MFEGFNLQKITFTVKIVRLKTDTSVTLPLLIMSVNTKKNVHVNKNKTSLLLADATSKQTSLFPQKTNVHNKSNMATVGLRFHTIICITCACVQFENEKTNWNVRKISPYLRNRQSEISYENPVSKETIMDTSYTITDGNDWKLQSKLENASGVSVGRVACCY